MQSKTAFWKHNFVLPTKNLPITIHTVLYFTPAVLENMQMHCTEKFGTAEHVQMNVLYVIVHVTDVTPKDKRPHGAASQNIKARDQNTAHVIPPRTGANCHRGTKLAHRLTFSLKLLWNRTKNVAKFILSTREDVHERRKKRFYKHCFPSLRGIIKLIVVLQSAKIIRYSSTWNTSLFLTWNNKLQTTQW